MDYLRLSEKTLLFQCLKELLISDLNEKFVLMKTDDLSFM